MHAKEGVPTSGKVPQWQSVTAEEHFGHLTTSWTVDNAERVNALVQEGRRITVTDIADKLDISYGICILHHPQGPLVTQNLCKCLPKLPTNMWALTGLCGNMHTIFAAVSWRWGFPATECHRRWNVGAPKWTCKQMSKHEVEKTRHRPEVYLLPAIWYWRCFWILMGPILESYVNRGQTVSSTRYCAMTGKQMILAIRSKCRGMLTNVVVLHHDNARRHTLAATDENDSTTEIQISPPPSIQSRFRLIRVPHFRTDQRCVTWTPICKQWRAASRATENSPRTASGSSWTE
jgi:hypothetical protein